MILEYLDSTLNNTKEVKSILSLPVERKICLRNYAIKTLSKPKSPVSEAYRTLRTNIQFTNVDFSVKKILLTSGAPGEGKSSTTANLAVTIAQTGKKVLVIDADLRNPTQHKVFKLPNIQGLSTTIVEDVPALAYAQQTGLDGLDVVVAGPIPPNPAELLGSRRMDWLLREATSLYDVVLIDAPPVLAVADSSILARLVDGVLLVVAAGEAKRDYTEQAKKQLEKVGAKILGVVLSKAKFKKSEHYYYYYNEKR